MAPSNDIYAKDVSGRWRKRRAVESTASAGASDPTVGRTCGSRRAHAASDRHRTSRSAAKHRRSSNRRKDESPDAQPTNRMLVAGLFAVAAVYLGVLGYTLFRDKPRPTAGSAATEATPSPKDVPAPDNSSSRTPAEETEQIARMIQNLERTTLAVEDAYRMMERGEHAQAESLLVRERENTPATIELQLALTQAYIEQKKYAPAKATLLEVLQSEPVNMEARRMLASILSTERNWDASLEVAKWILKTDVYSTEAHQIAATAYLNTDRPSMALPHLRRIATLDSDDTMALNNLAVAYYRIGHYEKAEAQLTQLLDQDDANSITHYNLAVCFAQQRKVEEAMDTLSHAAVHFGPSFVSTWMESPDFDPIREHTAFDNLRRQVSKPRNREPAAPAAAVRPGRPALPEDTDALAEHSPVAESAAP